MTSFILFFLIFIYLYLFLAVLALRFCARAFSSCGKRGPLFIAVRGPLTVAPLLLRSTSSRCAGSAVVAHGPSCSTTCGIFPDQGSNPSPLHWQADSQPLRHQGSPIRWLLSRNFSVQKGWHDIFKGIKGKQLQLRILYSSRLSFIREGKKEFYRKAKARRIQHH